MDNLRGKVVAITGAGSGIGRALAERLAQEGSHLAIADVSHDALLETANYLLKYGVRVTSHIVDVSKREQVHEFANDVIRHHQVVDMVINNAGVTLAQTVEDATYEDLEWVMGVNVWGVIYGTKAFLHHLKKREQAHIVNISSILGLIGSPVQPAYCATKFAVRGFTEALRLELAGTPIAVSCVYPGGIRTNFINNSRIYKDIVDPTLERPDKAEGQERFNNKYGLNSAQQAAKVIVEGIKKNKERIFVGRDARFIDYVSRVWPVGYPALVSFFYDHFYRRARPQPSSPVAEEDGLR